MDNQSTGAVLRIISNCEDVSFISEALSIKPTTVHKKGDLRNKRNPNSSCYENSIWILDSPVSDSADLCDHLNYLIKILELKIVNLKSRSHDIINIDIMAMFSCDSGQGSMTIDNNQMRKMSSLGINLHINLYPPS